MIYFVTYLTKHIFAVDQNNYSLPLEVSWHEHQSERQLQALRHHKPAGNLQTSSNRPGKFNEKCQVCRQTTRPPALIQQTDSVLTAGCLIHVVSWLQVFVLMQFGRKKDWPHGKLILHNSAWRIKIFITSHKSYMLSFCRERDTRIQRWTLRTNIFILFTTLNNFYVTNCAQHIMYYVY